MSKDKEPTERERIEAAKTYKEILRNKELHAMHSELTVKTLKAMRKIYGSCYQMDRTLSDLIHYGEYYMLPKLIGTLLKDLAEAKGVELTREDYLNND